MIKVAVLGSRGRMGSEVVKAVTEAKDLELVAELDSPLLGLATGQAMVIYDGDRVVGSATICETA